MQSHLLIYHGTYRIQVHEGETYFVLHPLSYWSSDLDMKAVWISQNEGSSYTPCVVFPIVELHEEFCGGMFWKSQPWHMGRVALF